MFGHASRFRNACMRLHLAVHLHGGQQHELVQVQAHGRGRVDARVKQQRVALGAQVRAQLAHQCLPGLLLAQVCCLPHCFVLSGQSSVILLSLS